MQCSLVQCSVWGWNGLSEVQCMGLEFSAVLGVGVVECSARHGVGLGWIVVK